MIYLGLICLAGLLIFCCVGTVIDDRTERRSVPRRDNGEHGGSEP